VDQMPDVVTHATFAIELSQSLDNSLLKETLERYQSIYFLGSQGPDVFYYYQLFSIKKDTKYLNFADIMHQNQVGNFLIESIKYLKSHYHESLHGYLCGFICHHALDRHAHPYVYYVTGNEEIEYRGNHMRLERAIDSLFIIHHWNETKPHLFNIHKKILNYHLDKTIFLPYYDEILSKVYHKENGGKAFLNATSNSKRIAKVIYDRYGIKKGLAKWLDKYFNKKSRIVLETLFYYHNIDTKIDYLNLNKKQWHHPVLKEVKSNESFIDLYKRGINEAKKEMDAISYYLENKIDEVELKTIIGNKSYETGLDCCCDNEMKYFNSIFK